MHTVCSELMPRGSGDDEEGTSAWQSNDKADFPIPDNVPLLLVPDDRAPQPSSGF